MKTIMLSLVMFMGLGLNATGPCAPVKPYKTVNAISGEYRVIENTKFEGNFEVTNKTYFHSWDEIFFVGTQTIRPHLKAGYNLTTNQSQKIFAMGNIDFDEITLLEYGMIFVQGNAEIRKLTVANNSQILVSRDLATTINIEGTNYKIGNIVKGIKIKYCDEFKQLVPPTQPEPPKTPCNFSVTFSELRGRATNKELRIDFKTANEVNVDYYRVMLSTSCGGNFCEWTTIKAKDMVYNMFNRNYTFCFEELWQNSQVIRCILDSNGQKDKHLSVILLGLLMVATPDRFKRNLRVFMFLVVISSVILFSCSKKVHTGQKFAVKIIAVSKNNCPDIVSDCIEFSYNK